MSANVESKKLIVEEIKAKVQESKSIVFADYNKLTVLEVTALRNKFKEANCEYKVYKNTLVRKVKHVLITLLNFLAVRQRKLNLFLPLPCLSILNSPARSC